MLGKLATRQTISQPARMTLLPGSCLPFYKPETMSIAKGKCNKPFNNAMVDDANRVILSFYLTSSVSFLCISVCM